MGVVLHELVVEGVPPLAGVGDVDFFGHIAGLHHIPGQVHNLQSVGNRDLGGLFDGLYEPEVDGDGEEDEEYKKIAVDSDQPQPSEYYFCEVGQHGDSCMAPPEASIRLLLLGLLAAFGIDVVAVNLDGDTLGNLDGEVGLSLVERLDGAIHAAGGDDLAADGEALAEVLDFFLALALWLDHEEIDDGEHRDNHDDHAPVEASFCSTLGCLHECKHSVLYFL